MKNVASLLLATTIAITSHNTFDYTYVKNTLLNVFLNDRLDFVDIIHVAIYVNNFIIRANINSTRIVFVAMMR